MSRSIEELGYLEAEVTMRQTEDGGRTHPIQTGYRPNWRLPGEAGDIWAGGSVELIGATEVAPGQTTAIRIYPFVPAVWESVEVGSRLEMCEGPVLVGKATVTRIVSAVVPVG